jgi:hypothetical protein
VLGQLREGGVGAAPDARTQDPEQARVEGGRVAAAVRLRRQAVARAMQLEQSGHGAAPDAELLGHFVERPRAAFVGEDELLAQVSRVCPHGQEVAQLAVSMQVQNAIIV